MAEVITGFTQISEITNSDPITFVGQTVADADAPIPVVANNFGDTLAGNGDGVNFSNQNNDLVIGDVYSAYGPLGSSYDISGAKQAIVVHFRHVWNGGSRINPASSALRFYLFSGGVTTNWAAWHYSGSTLENNIEWHPLIAGAGPPAATGGTFDYSDITGIGIGWMAKTTFWTQMEFNLGQLLLIDGPIILTDDNADATSIDGFVALLDRFSGQPYHNALIRQAGNLTEFGFPFEIRARNFSMSIESFAFRDDAVAFNSGTVAEGFYSAGFAPPLSGSQSLSNVTGATRSTDYDINLSGSAGSVSATSCLFASIRNVIIDGASATLNGVTFSEPLSIDIADGDLDITINGAINPINWSSPLSSGSIISDSSLDISFSETDLSSVGLSFTASNTVTVNPATGAGTYTLTGLTTTGTVTLDNDTANDTTIVLATGTSNTVASPTTGGGAITVIAPTDDLTVNSSETGSQIIVFATGTQTELDAEASASQLVYPHSTETVDITVFKDGFIPFRQTGLSLSGDVVVDVQLVPSREYNASHGLTYTTDASWSRANNELTVPTFGPTARNVFSLMLESFRAQASLRNTAFNLEMDGDAQLYLVNDAEGVNDATITNMTKAGVSYISSAGVTTAIWSGFSSVGDMTGFTAEYQQAVGSGTTDARASGNVDELVKVFGDATHGNFDLRSHMVWKAQPNGYYESRADVISVSGESTLSGKLYVFALEPQIIPSFTGGDPAISVTLVDHTAAPITVGGESFSWELQDNSAATASNIQRDLNFYKSGDTTNPDYLNLDPFNLPDWVRGSGSSFSTANFFVEGEAGLQGLYVSRSGSDHPGFSSFTADSGNVYTVPVTANGSITGITAGSRLRIYNRTTATETVNQINAGTSYAISYTDGTTYSSGDVVDVYLTYQSGTTAKINYSTTTVASVSGWSAIANQQDDTVYALNAIDGSLITKFTADYVDDEIDIASASDFTAQEAYAWWVYNLTTELGIRNFFGGVTATDAANYRINTSVVSIYWDNLTTTNIKQTDSARIYRDDDVYPVKNGGATTGGGGVDINWKNVVYLATTGSGPLTAAQEAQLASAASNSATAVTSTNLLINDQGLNASAPKVITEVTEGESYTEEVDGVTKTIVKSGSTTTVTRTS